MMIIYLKYPKILSANKNHPAIYFLNFLTPAISSATSPNNTQETKKHSQIAIKLNQKPSTSINSGQKKYIPPSSNKNNVFVQPILKIIDYNYPNQILPAYWLAVHQYILNLSIKFVQLVFQL